MPALQNTSLNDREATPVAHLFVPKDVITPGNIGRLVRYTGIPVGEETLTASTKQVGKRFKHKSVLTVPVVQTQTINGISAPVVVRTAFFDGTFTFDQESTEQERKNLVGMVMAMLDPTKLFINDGVIKLQGYTGS